METLTFLAVAVILYFASDRILDRIEVSRGARFEHRSIIFFVILFAMASAVFAIIQWWTGGGATPAA